MFYYQVEIKNSYYYLLEMYMSPEQEPLEVDKIYVSTYINKFLSTANICSEECDTHTDQNMFCLQSKVVPTRSFR